MTTGWLSIRNGQVINSYCDGLTFYTGAVVDKILFNGDLFGRPSGGFAKPVVIGPNEIIQEFQYSKAIRFYTGKLCYMIIKTDLNDYPIEGFDQWEGHSSDRQGYCDTTPQYSVQIPSNQDLGSFLDFNIVYDSQWIIGFKNETEPEYCIQILAGAFAGCTAGSAAGNSISLLHNGHEVFTFPSGFTDEEFCMQSSEVDIENDLFELENGGTDGVSRNIFSVHRHIKCFIRVIL